MQQGECWRQPGIPPLGDNQVCSHLEKSGCPASGVAPCVFCESTWRERVSSLGTYQLRTTSSNTHLDAHCILLTLLTAERVPPHLTAKMGVHFVHRASSYHGLSPPITRACPSIFYTF